MIMKRLNIQGQIIILVIISISMFTPYNAQTQTKEECFEFTTGLVLESAILVPALMSKNYDLKFYSMGVVTSIVGVIAAGEYFTQTKGSTSSAFLGGITAGAAGLLLHNYLYGSSITKNQGRTFVSLVFIFILPPFGATVGYNHQFNDSVMTKSHWSCKSSILEINENNIALNFPLISHEMISTINENWSHSNSYSIYGVDIISYHW